jgi:outer membrane protein assembly factor BamB
MGFPEFLRKLCLLLLAVCSQPIFAQSGNTATPSLGSSPSRDGNAPVDSAYLWRQAVGGAVIGRPTVQAQSVVLALDGGNIKAYSVSGRPLWDFSARGRLSPYVTRSREGTSYICRTNGIFIAVNRIGRELWRINIGGALAGPVVSGWDGRVFIPAARKIFCYTASGNLLWEKELESKIAAGPWLDQGGGILLALENAQVVRITHYGASSSWRLPAIPRILLSTNGNPDKGNIAVGRAPERSILALHANGNVQLLDMAFPNTAPVNLPRLPSAPLAAAGRGEYAAVAIAGGQVVLLSGLNGEVQWTTDSRVRFRDDAAIIYDERGIYVLNINGAAGFSADGKRQWYTVLKNASGIPAFDDEGVLYSGGKDWILYAWKLEERALNQKKTLYGPAPEGFYGTGIYPTSAFVSLSEYYNEEAVKKELESMRKEIFAGRVGEHEREWLVRLMEIANGIFADDGLRQSMFIYNRPRAHISQRITALQLLSRIGSSETIPWLSRFFRQETESLIKAAAAQAIGGIGVDPDGIALREFQNAANVGGDEQMLSAVAAATGALCRFSGPPLFTTGSRVLVTLSNPNQPPAVRRQALREMEGLAPNE